MRIRIKAYGKLNDYLEILNDYHFIATEFDSRTNEIYEGYIELHSLESLFSLAERIRRYFQSLNARDTDLLVIVYDKCKQEYVLGIYDGYRK
jgi:hypothetical protein